MPHSPYQSAVPLFIEMMGNMSRWLDKAAAQFDEGVLLEARLAPDMHPLPRQIQMASDSAKGAGARMTAAEAPSMPDTEASLAELKQRCERTIAYLRTIDPQAFDAGADREIVITFPSGAGMRFDGATYLAGFAVPNFLFHVTTAYAILRAQGVGLGKQDYLAHLAPHMFPAPAPAEG